MAHTKYLETFKYLVLQLIPHPQAAVALRKNHKNKTPGTKVLSKTDPTNQNKIPRSMRAFSGLADSTILHKAY